jgi:tRNA ligase
MAITVEDLGVAEAEGSSESTNDVCEFVSNLPDDTRSRLHITVGTKDETIKAVEAKTMVEQWRKERIKSSLSSWLIRSCMAESKV